MSDWYEGHNIITDHNYRIGMLSLEDVFDTEITDLDHPLIVKARKFCEDEIYVWSIARFEKYDHHITFRFPNDYDYETFVKFWQANLQDDGDDI